jgi:hypothetical protein
MVRARLITGLLLVLGATAVGSAPQSAPHADIDALARDVDRAESVRAVRSLQRLYAQYAQYGLWRDVGDLFASDARFTFDSETKAGKAAIAAFLRTRYGGGHDGLREGDVSTMLIESPLISLSADGRSAKGRWYMMALKGSKGDASIEGGTFENDYIRERGVWKIAAAHYTPQYAGPYESGWTNWGGGDLGIVPYHFTPESAGVPIPPATGPAPASGATLAGLQQRIATLNDEDQVRNLQSAYGYYADVKMWYDVVDLFAHDGLIEVAGAGVYRGPDGVRLWLETMGPAGLKHGQLNDRPQFDVVVKVMPGGHEAWARGIELGMLGDADTERGWWEVSVFRNRYVKEGGIWKIREMRRFPLFKTDYYQGWGKSRIVDPAPTGRFAPDAPVPLADTAAPGMAMPAFLQVHPVTGRAVTPVGSMKSVAAAPLTGAITAAGSAPIALAEARRRLNLSLAYDGVMNVSSAYTFYLDDYQSPQFGALVAEKGFKMSAFAGYYIGRDRVTQAGIRVWGKPPVTRTGVHFHWRPQPVVMVAPDGRSVNLRVRLWQPRTGKAEAKPSDFLSTGFSNGMYHDQFVLENGAWKFWNLSLDEPYIATNGWKGGWAKVKDPSPRPVSATAGAPSVLVSSNSDFKPDVPVASLGKRQEHFRGGTGEPLQWPSILPMWFEYRNPVSGRVPDHYQEDCAPCTAAPQLRLDRNGFMTPPDGPPTAER